MASRERDREIKALRRMKRVEQSASSHVPHEKDVARRMRSSSWWKGKISDGICYYCRAQFGPDELTMDHLIPLARGGKSEKINLVPACKECNNKKKHMLPLEWEEYMEMIKKRQL